MPHDRTSRDPHPLRPRSSRPTTTLHSTRRARGTGVPRALQLACAREIEAGRVESARLAFEILVGLTKWQAAIPSSMGVLLLSRQLESTMRAARSMLASGHLTRHDLDWLQANLARACALDLERVLEIAALIERVQQRTRYGSRGYLRPEMAPTILGDRTLLTRGHPPTLRNACAARFVEFTRAEHNAAYAAAARAMVAAYVHADHDDRAAELETWLDSAARDHRARFLVTGVRLWIDMWAAHEAAVADVHATTLLCALARSIDDHGAPPEALDDLVPDYLAAVPIDQRTGCPFSYARCHDAPGYDLWSRGPNGIDDPRPRASVETAGTARFRHTDDIEWTLRVRAPDAPRS